VSVKSSPAKAGTMPRTQAISAPAVPDTIAPARSVTTHADEGTAGTMNRAPALCCGGPVDTIR
jgi:hypothetical protein